ncbi:uncharacterized protein Nmlp_1958 [Natronomonas moolapensis 8.8.11]|uniref:Uncharacterized protein n=1 Tax=Natronomonas moolapensis (strain DSM 18674 / CECT 7526 / JCM 14361 / 8.8.11) TaxID=268739 RepID=M1XPY4_NATM8|nr:hypothetical protein [Natronomonas moolapensis]CCQ36143.1 uncharacterized protein Nmlp_1958 [Natronomonas moolapensis 8.8.11]
MNDSGDDGGGKAGGVTRRRVLLGGGASVATVGGAKALYNTVLGYGRFGMGTNLEEQDLAALAAERLVPTYEESIGGTRVRLAGDGIVVDGETTLSFDDDPADVEELDSRLGFGGRLRELFADAAAVRAGTYAFEFHDPPAFFDRMDDGEPRPEVVTAIRTNWDRTVDPGLVGRFAGVDPSDPAAVVEGLVGGFREHTHYDVPRYLAGSIEDNVILGAADLRQYFEDAVEFEALLESDGTGIFCWELVYRSIEALHAVSPARQAAPIAACYVIDRRHKHAFTGLLGAIRVDDGLRFPMTFVDYTHTTMYDDFRLTGVLGEGLDAYNDRHRASEIYW